MDNIIGFAVFAAILAGIFTWLKYLVEAEKAACNCAAYPNGRYDRWIPDEMVCNDEYSLIEIKGE